MTRASRRPSTNCSACASARSEACHSRPLHASPDVRARAPASAVDAYSQSANVRFRPHSPPARQNRDLHEGGLCPNRAAPAQSLPQSCSYDAPNHDYCRWWYRRYYWNRCCCCCCHCRCRYSPCSTAVASRPSERRTAVVYCVRPDCLVLRAAGGVNPSHTWAYCLRA